MAKVPEVMMRRCLGKNLHVVVVYCHWGNEKCGLVFFFFHMFVVVFSHLSKPFLGGVKSQSRKTSYFAVT